MSITEPERHELYEIVKDKLGPRGADLFMTAVPPHSDRLATKDDVALAVSDLRAEMARLGADLERRLSSQTRVLVFTLVGSVTALAIANTATVVLAG